jgi:KEOPS complex subunit Pcc1
VTPDAPVSTEGAKLPLAAGDDASGNQREPAALAQPAHTATLSVSYPSPESASLVAESLRPEVDQLDDDRAAATVDRDGRTVTVTVHASDLVALRAGTGSWSRLLTVAERTAGLGDGDTSA